ncbi:MAG: hypothetical protein GX117_14890 [Candidatus Hydrogenedentes bacterium]|nr:hypothetical protein [Candidatus Hydrogenedentota bacterium]
MAMVILSAWLSFGVAFSATEPSAPQDTSLSFHMDTTTLALHDGDTPLFQYRYGDVPFKGYLQSWFTKKGVNLLSDAPEDHKHHHGLMYAVTVNDINFWEEAEDAGRQEHQRFSNIQLETDSARFTTRVQWQEEDAQSRVLEEERTLIHHWIGDPAVQLLTWRSDLTRSRNHPSVSLTGTIYHGLGMRFPDFMAQKGSFFFADDETGSFDDGPHHLAQASWCAYTVNDDNTPVTVAFFAAKDNARPTLWFTMKDPFAYLSATFNLSRNPLTVEGPRPLSILYGLASWDRVVDEATIEALYKEWCSLTHQQHREHFQPMRRPVHDHPRSRR